MLKNLFRNWKFMEFLQRNYSFCHATSCGRTLYVWYYFADKMCAVVPGLLPFVKVIDNFDAEYEVWVCLWVHHGCWLEYCAGWCHCV